jgi:hypothetical protein
VRERVATHGVRRSAEMREAGELLAALGIDPALANAVADAQLRGARRQPGKPERSASDASRADP